MTAHGDSGLKKNIFKGQWVEVLDPFWGIKHTIWRAWWRNKEKPYASAHEITIYYRYYDKKGR